MRRSAPGSSHLKAALSPTTGRVLVIGYYGTSKGKALFDNGAGREAIVIELFWKKFTQMKRDGRSMVGLNIFQFDLPFLVTRSWILDVEIP